MMEEWRDVVGYEGLYQVSSLGRVKSLARSYHAPRKGTMALIPIPERMLSRVVGKVGYFTVGLSRLGKTKTVYVHQLVCEAWHGPRPTGHDVAHSDGDKLNCAPQNLRWATRRENLLDKARHGTQPRGNDLWFTKIPDAVVREIRRDKDKSVTQWARELGVCHGTVSAIRRGNERIYA